MSTNTRSFARLLKEIEPTRRISLTSLARLHSAPLNEFLVSSVFISMSTLVRLRWNLGFVCHHTTLNRLAGLFVFGFAWIYQALISSVLYSMRATARNCARVFREVQDAASDILTLLRWQSFASIDFGLISAPFLVVSAYSRLYTWFFLIIQ